MNEVLVFKDLSLIKSNICKGNCGVELHFKRLCQRVELSCFFDFLNDLMKAFLAMYSSRIPIS